MPFTASDISSITAKVTGRMGNHSTIEAHVSFSSDSTPDKRFSRVININLPTTQESDQTVIQTGILNILNAQAKPTPDPVPLPPPITFTPKA